MENEKNAKGFIELAKRRGFFWPTAEIYGSIAGFWNYGPLGTTLKRKVIDAWRKYVVKRDDMIEIDGAQIMPMNVFKSSGHLSSFQDPLVECTKCKKTYRADRLIQEKTGKTIPEAMKPEDFDKLLKENNIKCSCGGEFSKTEMFNLMVKTFIGPKQNEIAYLRPETCQSIFTDFSLIYRASRAKLPVGMAQVGKSFRNEISPRDALFRTREFTQAEVEVFFNPKKENSFEKYEMIKDYKIRFNLVGKDDTVEMSCEEAFNKKIFRSKIEAYYLVLHLQFFERIGIPRENMRIREIGPDERPFYAQSAWDLEVKTSLGWTEIIANHYRADHDLKSHSEGSGVDLSVMDVDEKVLPWVWEDSMGIDRLVLALLDIGLKKEGERVYLKLSPEVSPYQVAVFPLVNKDGIDSKALEVYNLLKDKFDVFYDDSGSIGRRYARQDEIGTPFCITIDYDTKENDTVTLRYRDTTKQDRVKIEDLVKIINQLMHQ
jgi:glycyl-tRNA synthetase